MILTKAVFVFLAAFVFAINNVNGQGPVSRQCMNCICQHGCAITYKFWVDGGYPAPPNAGSYPFPRCFLDRQCSERAIQNYMNFNREDCDGNGRIDCLDYAAIHRAGPYGCRYSYPTGFVQEVSRCLRSRG